MKKTLTISSAGEVSIAPFPAFTPPLGLCLCAGQDTSAAPPTSRTLATLFSAVSPAIPAGMNVITDTDIYVYTGAAWLNTQDYSNADSATISGTVLFRNPTDYDIGITW